MISGRSASAADIAKMPVGHRVDDGDGFARLRFARQCGFDPLRPGIDIGECDQPDRQIGLAAQDPAEIGIAHRVQRVVLHRAFAEQDAIDEQMTRIDRASGAGKGRAGDGLASPDEVEQRL